MKKGNPIIRGTNRFLLSLLAGGVFAWILSSIGRHEGFEANDRRGREVPKKGVGNLEEARQVALSVSSSDADGDGLPDQWEIENQLDPADPEDYLSDFDLDGLTALHEYQQGTNPLGNWAEVSIDLGSRIKLDSQSYKKLTDFGYFLAAGNADSPAFSGERVGVLWHKETGAVEINYEGDYKIYPWDVNNYGEVVGGAIPPGGVMLRFM